MSVKRELKTVGMVMEELIDLLCLADEALMLSHGCFPLDRTNEKDKLLNDAAHAIRRVTGGDPKERVKRSERARQRYPGREP